uniref:GATA-type domain-containing protein n=1 Tax=Anopheles culicifacies TaxID=139723 RepID=A0A182M8N2_9DIPT
MGSKTHPHRSPNSRTDDPITSLAAPLQMRHLQHTIQGAASKSSGEATSNSMPNPANIPITCARCHTTDAREWPKQKSSRHVGQCTAQGDAMMEDDGDIGTIRSVHTVEPLWLVPAWPACCSVAPTRQIVSQPAFGHHVRNRSSSTSVQ